VGSGRFVYQRLTGFVSGTGLAVAVLAGCVGSGEAAAQSATRAPQRAKPAAAVPAPTKREDSLLAVVSIAKQQITVHGPGGIIGQSPVSTGMRGKDTPTGVFTILQKNKHHVSNIYEGASMPNMQRLTWSGIALHAGYLPGYPASHGCIRMPMAFSEKLWEMTKLGARVVVVPGGEQAREVAHASLPAPALLPVVADLPQPVRLAAREGDERTDAAPAVSEARLLNPVDRARATKEALATQATAKQQEAKHRATVAATKAREAASANYAYRVAVRLAADWQVRRNWLEKHMAVQRQPQAIATVGRQWVEAEKRLVQARDAEATARERDAQLGEEAKEAQKLAAAAKKESDAATIAAKSAEKAASGEPISVFVSRKTGRIQVRQGWQTLHDAPVSFKDGSAPLGTHVYVALEPVGRGDALRWISVSFNGAPPVVQGQKGRAAVPARPATGPISAETAESVLEQFDMSPDSRKFVSERLWTGATLIVSDQGPSHETGRDTDFVILTR
jgi:hypothetical protein